MLVVAGEVAVQQVCMTIDYKHCMDGKHKRKSISICVVHVDIRRGS